MAKIKWENGKAAIFLSKQEFDELGFKEQKEYQIIKAKDGLFLVAEKEAEEKIETKKTEKEEKKEATEKPKETQKEKIEEKKDFFETDKKLFLVLSGKKNLQERVEGKFENRLSKKELERFQELLKKGIIVRFRLSQKYKKAIYEWKGKKPEREERKEIQAQAAQKEKIETKRIELLPKEQEKPQAKKIEQKGIQQTQKEKTEEKKFEPDSPKAFLFKRDGFTVIENEGEAKEFCDIFEEEIRASNIRGIRGFDKNFYVIDSQLYEKLSAKIIKAFNEKKEMQLSELAQTTRISPLLSKTICEFLKDEGEIIEKRKEFYKIV